ncbi:MAG: CCA tRNA nucleotidyltransferase [Candidatus Omnitrophica bacterium]|nr:CCA tRNA nucleotidyltransferase [Candidatus Omnitrophota bacterium]
MNLTTTHKNADLDALSSVAAASKLYPSALSACMSRVLPAKLLDVIRKIGREADAMGMNAFLVGGFVRDFFLGAGNFDLDVVVEGDAIKFGKVIADGMKGSLVVHHKFGTATVVKDKAVWFDESLNDRGKFKIDIATARKEVYERPAALPTVAFSSLRDDLHRRDFTINAMAININRHNFGLFIDFFGGMRDLERRIIRVLHDKSFIDDPTRIFRAVRFEQRFGFRIEEHTEYLIRHAVKQEMFRRTENQRIREELVLLFKEKDPEKAICRMKKLHELRFIHPGLKAGRALAGRFRELRECAEWYGSAGIKKRRLDIWLMYLMILLEPLGREETREVLDKFVFTRSEHIRILSYKDKAAKVIRKLSSKTAIKNSALYFMLEPLSHETTLCIMARTASRTAKARVRRFFMRLNGRSLSIKGEDLAKMGLRPGPAYKDILEKVFSASLDGKVSGKREELNLAKELVKGLKQNEGSS